MEFRTHYFQSLYWKLFQKLSADSLHRPYTDLDNPKVDLIPTNHFSVLKRPIKIVLSPGHGGKDRGCTGIKGNREADVARTLAKYMKEHFDKKVVECRIHDQYEHKKEYPVRVLASNLWGADYYVPIHFNWSPSPKTNGAFIMLYREESKRMGMARQLMKDFTNQYKISFKDYGDSNKDGVMIRNKGRGVYELKKPNAVTLYLELGFLSNPQWEDTIQQEDGIKNMSKVLVKSFQDFFIENPNYINYTNLG